MDKTRRKLLQGAALLGVSATARADTSDGSRTATSSATERATAAC